MLQLVVVGCWSCCERAVCSRGTIGSMAGGVATGPTAKCRRDDALCWLAEVVMKANAMSEQNRENKKSTCESSVIMVGL